MEQILPIGSIVRLNNGNQKLMIINRAPLYNNEGSIGYFEYSGCLYPNGQTNQNVFFFNEENIAEVLFMGYSDEDEEKFCTMFKEEIDKGNYPRLKLQIEGR
ncbi:DUF4176 domain-containing protein [Cellulosilyticum sp. WCF-2]|uniref:DUF4176 domain-containing protein n=1 Tax=Cellulosilyticum sp. WCF-2 TaxID=2497860 RepID=UPI000F8EEF0B|nr:DUF4176 domain-containing protein [Cellulosilyticum sp. WCF-2]QEH67855.1 DUF4176 domain-containing protein [Cellulosilyticum sp. WCF-2]